MKITHKELKEMIDKAVRKNLQEGSTFSARRVIDAVAGDASREFEKQIVQNLGIVDPDELRPEMQAKYLEIVGEMEKGFKNAVRAAVKKLQNFPKKEDVQQKEGSGYEK
jgi:putative lipoic acid-binding regulatory protein